MMPGSLPRGKTACVFVAPALGLRGVPHAAQCAFAGGRQAVRRSKFSLPSLGFPQGASYKHPPDPKRNRPHGGLRLDCAVFEDRICRETPPRRPRWARRVSQAWPFDAGSRRVGKTIASLPAHEGMHPVDVTAAGTRGCLERHDTWRRRCGQSMRRVEIGRRSPVRELSPPWNGTGQQDAYASLGDAGSQ